MTYINVSGYQWKIYYDLLWEWNCTCTKIDNAGMLMKSRQDAVACAKVLTKKHIEKEVKK